MSCDNGNKRKDLKIVNKSLVCVLRYDLHKQTSDLRSEPDDFVFRSHGNWPWNPAIVFGCNCCTEDHWSEQEANI